MNKMKRLTSERVNGIKQGYWSSAKKDERFTVRRFYGTERCRGYQKP